MERTKKISPQDIKNDFIGNNAAFTCPECGKVFIVSGMFHKKGRPCPNCGQYIGFVRGGASSGGEAFIQTKC